MKILAVSVIVLVLVNVKVIDAGSTKCNEILNKIMQRVCL